MKVTLSSVLVLTALHIVLLVSNSLSQSCGNGDLRLRGPGSTRFKGRMEVCYNDTWGTVCQTAFASPAVNGPVFMTACKQLGLSHQGGRITLGTLNNGPFGEGSGPIHLDVVVCAGDERALIDCRHTDIGGVLKDHCTHATDAGVVCADPQENCIEGTVRLVNGSTSDTSIQGRVELCVNQTWSTVLGSNWGDEEAMVVCRQLGYSDLGATTVPGGTFGMRIGPILDIQCTGNESRLDLCIVSNNDRNYDHSNDAGVICLPQVVVNLCTNQSFFDSVCEVVKTDATIATTTTVGIVTETASETTTMPACTCPTGTSPISGTAGSVGGNNCTGTPLMDSMLPAVLGALLGVTVLVLICAIIGWVVTYIVMKGKLNISKRTYDLTESTTSTKEFKNPTYGTSATLPTRQSNGKGQHYEGPTYEVAGPATSIGQKIPANPNLQPVYSTADEQPELVYDTPDYNDRGPNGTQPVTQGGVMYSTLDDDRSGPDGPIQSRPRENVDMSGVEEYGKLRR